MGIGIIVAVTGSAIFNHFHHHSFHIGILFHQVFHKFFQFFNLFDSLNVSDNVAIPLYLNGMKSTKALVREKLAQIGISELQDRPLNTLSGGQLQRVAIARAIVHKPKLILADEPTGNLDSKNALAILELLNRLKKEENITIIMATHSSQASNMADQVYQVIDGNLTKIAPLTIQAV